jgi:hypothetical protein
MATERSTIPDVAFYYPGPVWYSGDAIKNLLLFFDGIGLLVPHYLLDKPERMDPALALPLREKGLLHLIEPEEHVDADATKQLAETLREVIASGAFDELAQADAVFHELSMSRLGFYGDAEIAEDLFNELKRIGLVKNSEDGVSIPMRREVRVFILVLLAQLLRPKGNALGVALTPATDRPELVQALSELLDAPALPSAGHVVTSDLLTVGVDLSLVPLDEVLDYRQQNREIYRQYARNVRAFVRDLAGVSAPDRTSALADRQEELAELSNDLRRASRAAWKRPASFALSGGGAVWTATTGDPLGALLALGAFATGLETGQTNSAGAFSFLFSAPGRHRFG